MDNFDVFEKQEIKDEIKEPSMYKVIMLNDDYSTMDFVVDVLRSIFNKTSLEAERIMLEIHRKGSGICGVYSYDIACTKIDETHREAVSNDFPLRCIMEKDS